jgi:hypothetical protein
MKQRTNESVQDYFVRCNEIYDRIKEIRPAALQQWRGPLPAGVNNNANLNLGKVQGVKEMGLFFLHLLFVAGLREDIRTKTIEADDANLEAARVSAKRIELVLQDKRQQKVMNINKDPDSNEEDSTEEYSEDEYLDLTEDEVVQLNAVRASRGKRPIRPRRKFKRDLRELNCHYCGKKGHYQKVCRKRIKEKGAMVFNKANNIESEDSTPTAATTTTTEAPTEAAMSITGYYGVNSINSLN